VTDKSVITYRINNRTNHQSFLEFRSNVEIPRQAANSVARLEILRPAENCGP